MIKKIIIILAIIIVIISAYFIYRQIKTNKNNVTPTSSSPTAVSISTPMPISTSSSTPAATDTLADPISQFKARVTKKPFGIYITPQNSPVQSERFTGYHTGADAEYQDVVSDVPVYALADGTIVLARTASGYGGVLMIEFSLNGVRHTALYGHLRPSSLPQVGQSFKKGDQMAVIGTGYSTETDGERRHLHFAILSDNGTDLKGYVQNKSELSGWIDPLSLY